MIFYIVTIYYFRLKKEQKKIKNEIEQKNHVPSRVFSALIILTLSWAISAVMMDVGTNRMFSLIIVESSLSPEALPTLSYIISAFITLATGTS